MISKFFSALSIILCMAGFFEVGTSLPEAVPLWLTLCTTAAVVCSTVLSLALEDRELP